MPHIAASEIPEGIPADCPVCKKKVFVDPSEPLGDAPCPNCGGLIFIVAAKGQARLRRSETVEDAIRARLGDLDLEAMDSLDLAELVMELEDEDD